MQKISLALSLLLITGCAQFNLNGQEDQVLNRDPYSKSNFDELLAFGANMSNLPPLSRSEVCSTLLKHQKDSPSAGIKLHLMMGRLFSDVCGNIPEILDGVDSITHGSLSDDRVQKLVSIYTEALKRLHDVSIKLDSLERKYKKLQFSLESKKVSSSKKIINKPKKDVKDLEEPTDDQSQLLREKLEAIRSMEKHLDESDNGN